MTKVLRIRQVLAVLLLSFTVAVAGASVANANASTGNVWTAGPAKITMADSSAAYTTWLKPGQVLNPGDYVRSANGGYRLLMQTDGNLVLYVKVGTWWVAIWSTQTHGYSGVHAVMQKDGNFVLYQGTDAIWSTQLQNYKIKGLVVQDDGNVVTYSTTHKPLWHRWITITSPHIEEKLYKGYSIVSANRVFKLTMQADGNLVLYKGNVALWSSRTKVKNSYAVLQADGNFVIYHNTTAIWSTRTAHNPGASFVVQDDGNAVIYQDATPIWSTGTHG